MKKEIAKRSIWNILTAGIDINAKKEKLWYEIIPGLYAEKAVTLGRTKNTIFGKKTLILYRDDNQCNVSWIKNKFLISRT